MWMKRRFYGIRTNVYEIYGLSIDILTYLVIVANIIVDCEFWGIQLIPEYSKFFDIVGRKQELVVFWCDINKASITIHYMIGYKAEYMNYTENALYCKNLH